MRHAPSLRVRACARKQTRAAQIVVVEIERPKRVTFDRATKTPHAGCARARGIDDLVERRKTLCVMNAEVVVAQKLRAATLIATVVSCSAIEREANGRIGAKDDIRRRYGRPRVIPAARDTLRNSFREDRLTLNLGVGPKVAAYRARSRVTTHNWRERA